MKKILSFALSAAVALSAADGAHAQGRVSLFDLGLYGGGAVSSSWFEVNDNGHSPGLSPIFGATASFFAAPSFGLRLHYGYMPSALPFAGENLLDRPNVGADEYPLNNHFYDLDLVFRPAFLGFLGGPYAFIGAGALTSNPAGGNERGFSRTVGQGTAGIGFDLVRLFGGVGLFLELATHGYDSPIDDDDRFALGIPNNLAVEDQNLAFTTRLVAGLKFSFGGRDRGVAPVMAPLPPPPPAPAPTMTPIRVCVVEAGELREVDAMVNPATGDTLVNQRRFADVYPATMGYAAGQDFYLRNEAITLNRTRYVRFGLTRIVPATALTRAGEFQGVPVFRDRSATGTPEVLYVPVRTGCEFQTYQREQAVRGVRG